MVAAATGCARPQVSIIKIQHSRDVHIGARLVLPVITIILVVVALFLRRPKRLKRLTTILMMVHHNFRVRNAILALTWCYLGFRRRGILPGDLRLVPGFDHRDAVLLYRQLLLLMCLRHLPRCELLSQFLARNQVYLGHIVARNCDFLGHKLSKAIQALLVDGLSCLFFRLLG